MAFLHRRWLFWPAAVLNAAVIASTMTTGWHYLADVLGGAAVAGVAILATRMAAPWLYPGSAKAGSNRSDMRAIRY